MRGRSNLLRVSLDNLSLSISIISLETLSTKGDFVSFGVSHRRRLRRYLSSATSPSVALVGDLSLGGSPVGDRALSQWLFRNRKFVGSVSRWFFSSKLFLGGSNRSSHLKSKG
ncbi:hypothetical protein F2Q69_00026596 [Brassica cretica]|uniref:Uncharacterized protein n=1 Tax=Brassica cretica TaxID=69181 RepID=A0A8S9RUA9_BRACR|nr:hypothetical protein F2Q69_00026596 [Brassica cretica]